MATKKKTATKKTATKKTAKKPRAPSESSPYLEVFERLRPTLAKLPYASADQLAMVRQFFAKTAPGLAADPARLQKLFAEQVHGHSPFVAHAMLVFLRELSSPIKAKVMTPKRPITKPVVHRGDLVIRGHVHNRSVIAALGDVTIEGNYVATPEYPCLFASGTVRCANYYANEAMVIAADGIEVEGLMFLKYNHTITIAPTIRTQTLVQQDAGIDGEVTTERHITENLGFDGYADLFGDPLYEELTDVVSDFVVGRFLQSFAVLAD